MATSCMVMMEKQEWWAETPDASWISAQNWHSVMPACFPLAQTSHVAKLIIRGWDISPVLRRINCEITWWMTWIQGGVKTCSDAHHNSGVLCLFLTLVGRDSSGLTWEINPIFGLSHETYIPPYIKGVPFCLILLKVFNQESKLNF